MTDAVTIIDGDTFRLGTEIIRLLGADTPETYRPRCAAELRLGGAAKARLGTLLLGVAPVVVRSGVDRYGRTLAVVRTPTGEDVGEVLIREGLALPWRPGPAAKAQRLRAWCPEGRD
jgi:micrococcal nuclease